MKKKIEFLINKCLERYEFELPKDEYSVIADELAQEIVKLFAIPAVVGRSEQYTCECKVCGKPFENNEDYYMHYDEEHN